MRPRFVVTMVVLWAAAGGCGGAQQMRAEEAPSTSVTGTPTEEQQPGDPRRAEIERLERQIDAQSGTAQRAASPSVPGVNPPGVSRQQGADAAPSCEDVCQASGSICRAAARICSLADEMDDDWSRNKCRRASRTCTDARRRSTDACGTC